MKSTKQQRMSIRRMLLLIIVGIILVIIQPFLWRLVRTQAERLQEKRSADQQVTGVAQRSQAITDTTQAQAEELASIEQVAPPPDNLTSIIDSIEQIADSLQVNHSITNIAEQTDVVRKNQAPGPIQPIAVSIQAQGNVDNLLDYLDRLEQLPQINVVTLVSLVPSVQEKTTGTSSQSQAVPYAASIDLTFFFSSLNNGTSNSSN